MDDSKFNDGGSLLEDTMGNQLTVSILEFEEGVADDLSDEEGS